MSKDEDCDFGVDYREVLGDAVVRPSDEMIREMLARIGVKDFNSKDVLDIIGALRSDNSSEALEVVNEKVNGHGVESFRNEATGHYIEYVNMGDTYDTTLLYSPDIDEFLLMSWGDYIEEIVEKEKYATQMQHILDAIDGVDADEYEIKMKPNQRCKVAHDVFSEIWRDENISDNEEGYIDSDVVIDALVDLGLIEKKSEDGD